MKEDWISKLDAAMGPVEISSGGDARVDATKESVRLFFGLWLAYRLEMNKELKMTPWQWEMVEYQGTDQWDLRRFPFERLQSIKLSEKGTMPELEARFAPGGAEVVELYLNIPEQRTDNRIFPKNCLLFRGSFEEASEGLKKWIPEVMERWTDAMVKNDPRPLFDWALNFESEQENR